MRSAAAVAAAVAEGTAGAAAAPTTPRPAATAGVAVGEEALKRWRSWGILHYDWDHFMAVSVPAVRAVMAAHAPPPLSF
eukprot:COSAG01_NODE_6000_length_3908_cov_4.117616_4_plen_79_part_00